MRFWIIDEIIGKREMKEWDRIFRHHDLTWAPVQSNEEVAFDSQMEANGLFVEMTTGKRTVDSPLNVAGVKKVTPGPAPAVGQHTREVLGSLGYSDAEIADMVKKGAAMEPKKAKAG